MINRLLLKSVRHGALRQVVMVMIAVMGVVGIIPSTSQASVIPTNEAANLDVRTEDMATVKTFLERKEVAERLSEYGLTEEEVSSRLDRLTDEQLSEIAGQVDQLNAGGDALGALVSLALLVLLVLVILHFLGYIDLRLPRPAKKSSSPSN